jgi:hypothetical protein
MNSGFVVNACTAFAMKPLGTKILSSAGSVTFCLLAGAALVMLFFRCLVTFLRMLNLLLQFVGQI